MFTFEYPWLGIGAFVVFVVASIWFRRRKQALLFAHIHKSLDGAIPLKKFRVVEILKWLAFGALALALASPVVEHTKTKDAKGYNICLVLDASLSMSERGFDPYDLSKTRFDVVKDIVGDFAQNRTNDNLSIVVFGDFSFVALPLSFDKKMAQSIIKTLRIGMAGRQTAIFDALAQSTTALNAQKAKKKIAILLTDGQNTTGEIPYNVAMRMAKEHAVTVYAIGIGQAGEYDVGLLEDIAKQTGGAFFQATQAGDLERIYERIDALERHDIKVSVHTKKEYFYNYPLMMGLVFLLAYVLLGYRKVM